MIAASFLIQRYCG